MRTLIRVFLALGLTLFVYYRLFGSGIPMTHDGPIHTVRMAGYYLALQQGQFPPRIGPNMANGLGYPVFNYNYPLANIAVVPLIKLHVSYPQAYQVILFSFILLGVLGVFELLSSFSFGFIYQLLGAVLFATSPFLVSQVFVRGGVGEIAFIGVFPWALWAINQLFKAATGRNQLVLGVIGGVLALSHNILAVFCVPILVIYSVWLIRTSLQKIVFLIIPALIAFLLSAFFWIPALFEKSLVVLDDAPITLQFTQHFLHIHQFLASAWAYGFSRPGPVDGMSFALSFVELLLLLAVSATIMAWKNNLRLVILWVVTIICFGLTLVQFEPLWRLIPISSYIQFPWRLLWFGHFSLLLLIVFWARLFRISKQLVLVVMLVSLMLSNRVAIPQSRTDRTHEEWLRAGETTSTMNENLPKTANLNLAYQLMDSTFKENLVWVSSSSAKIDISTWDGTSRKYTITTDTPLTVVERTFYFPGWETHINGKPTQVSSSDPWKAGLLTYTLLPGNYDVKTQFTQRTLARQVGNGLTILGLIFTFGWMIFIQKKHVD